MSFSKPARQLWGATWIADNEFQLDLPNCTINLLIQWIRQNSGRMPERRRNARELRLRAQEQIQKNASISGMGPVQVVRVVTTRVGG